MKKLDVPIIAVGKAAEHHSCGGHCKGRPRKDGYCYHDGGTRHPIGQCRERRNATPSAHRSGAADDANVAMSP